MTTAASAEEGGATVAASGDGSLPLQLALPLPPLVPFGGLATSHPSASTMRLREAGGTAAGGRRRGGRWDEGGGGRAEEAEEVREEEVGAAAGERGAAADAVGAVVVAEGSFVVVAAAKGLLATTWASVGLPLAQEEEEGAEAAS